MALGKSQQKITRRCLEIEQLLGVRESAYDHTRVSLDTPFQQKDGYNCIAFAASDDERRWWPSKEDPRYYYWPPHLDRREPGEETVEDFVQAFESLGYSRKRTNAKLEKGIEKIAIFVDADDLPTHAARQLESGRWANKCGDYEDIECFALDVIPNYGKPIKYMKRRRDGKAFFSDRVKRLFRRYFMPLV